MSIQTTLANRTFIWLGDLELLSTPTKTKTFMHLPAAEFSPFPLLPIPAQAF